MRGTNARMPTNRRPRLARVPVLFDNSTSVNSHEDCTFTQYCGSTDPEGCCDYCFCFVCNQPAKDRPEWGDKGDHHRVCEKKWQMRRKKWAAAHRLLRHSPTLNRQVTVTRYRTRETGWVCVSAAFTANVSDAITAAAKAASADFEYIATRASGAVSAYFYSWSVVPSRCTRLLYSTSLKVPLCRIRNPSPYLCIPLAPTQLRAPSVLALAATDMPNSSHASSGEILAMVDSGTSKEIHASWA